MPRSPGELLAAAFQDDAMFQFVEPGPDRRHRVLPWFFAGACRLGRRYGRLDIDPDRGAAIWLAPGTTMGVAALVSSGMVFAPIRLGLPAFRRFATLTSAFERAGRRAHGSRPFWHLFILGVAPELHGTGVGSGLIAPVLAMADQRAEPVYLETLRESNIAFYQQLGFRVVERVHEPDLPTFWTMLREPSGA